MYPSRLSGLLRHRCLVGDRCGQEAGAMHQPAEMALARSWSIYAWHVFPVFQPSEYWILLFTSTLQRGVLIVPYFFLQCIDRCASVARHSCQLWRNALRRSVALWPRGCRLALAQSRRRPQSAVHMAVLHREQQLRSFSGSDSHRVHRRAAGHVRPLWRLWADAPGQLFATRGIMHSLLPRSLPRVLFFDLHAYPENQRLLQATEADVTVLKQLVAMGCRFVNNKSSSNEGADDGTPLLPPAHETTIAASAPDNVTVPTANSSDANSTSGNANVATSPLHLLFASPCTDFARYPKLQAYIVGEYMRVEHWQWASSASSWTDLPKEATALRAGSPIVVRPASQHTLVGGTGALLVPVRWCDDVNSRSVPGRPRPDGEEEDAAAHAKALAASYLLVYAIGRMPFHRGLDLSAREP